MTLRRIVPLAAVLALACSLPSSAGAQDTAQAQTPTFYSLIFRVIDRDGKRIVSSRSYKTSVAVGKQAEGWNASVDSRDLIPPPRGVSGGDTRIGFEVDVLRTLLASGRLGLYMRGEMESLPTDDAVAPGNLSGPIVRSNRWAAYALLPMNTPTIVYSSDDPASTHVFEVELTASPMGAQ